MTACLDLADALQVVDRYGFHVDDVGLLAAASTEAVQAVHIAKTTYDPAQAVKTPQSVREEATEPIQGVEAEAKAFIYFKKSSNDPAAINRTSGACGLGQALPCSKLTCSLTDYACEDAWFTSYMEERSCLSEAWVSLISSSSIWILRAMARSARLVA